jgi:hypothetical protein
MAGDPPGTAPMPAQHTPHAMAGMISISAKPVASTAAALDPAVR